MYDVKHLAPFVVMIILLVILAITLVNWFNYRLKKRLLDAGPVDEKLLHLISQLWRPGAEALKWGLLFLSGGLGLILVDYLPNRGDDLVLPFGVEAVFLSAGFLTYYAIIRKQQ